MLPKSELSFRESVDLMFMPGTHLAMEKVKLEKITILEIQY